MTKQDLLSDGLERVSQAAKRMGVSRNVLYKWIREGRITYLRIHDCVRIPTRAVNEMLENGLHLENTQGE